MKRNVDLTENNLFTGITLTLKEKYLLDMMNFILPWDLKLKPILLDRDKDIMKDNSLIVCGNKAVRQAEKYRQLFNGSTSCDRCGAAFNIPWNRRYDLCDRCYDILDYQVYGGMKWKEIIRNNNQRNEVLFYE